MEIKLPRLYSYVYVITYVDFQPYCISKDMVFMKNNKEFITEDMLSRGVINEYRHSLDTSEYGNRWTHTLKEAKDAVIKWAKEHVYDVDIKKTCDNSWNIDMTRIMKC